MRVTAFIFLTLAILGAMFALMVALNAFDRKQKQLLEALKNRYFPSHEKPEATESKKKNQNEDTET
jgi:hypothetical protein